MIKLIMLTVVYTICITLKPTESKSEFAEAKAPLCGTAKSNKAKTGSSQTVLLKDLTPLSFLSYKL